MAVLYSTEFCLDYVCTSGLVFSYFLSDLFQRFHPVFVLDDVNLCEGIGFLVHKNVLIFHSVLLPVTRS